MRSISRIRPTAWKLALGAAVFAALGGVAYAATNSSFVGSNGAITACAQANGGQVHVWKPGHHCSGGWVGVAFAASGQLGVAGPAGATGATGAAGPSNAATVDGDSLSNLDLKMPTPSSSTSTEQLYAANGLTIVASCDPSGNASLAADGPASADSELTVSGYANAAGFGSQTSTLGASSLAVLGPAGSGEVSFSYAASAGTTVTGTIGYQKATSFGGYVGCAFFGSVTSG
jgi:hypothetical protein